MKLLTFVFISTLIQLHLLWAHEPKEQSKGIKGNSQEKLSLTPEKIEAAKIQIETAGPGTLQNYIRVPGKIEIHPNYIASVIPKVNGVVREIRKNIGDRVDQDEILAVLESKEMAEAKSNYVAALKKLELRRTILAREEELKGISPELDLLNAKWSEQEAFINLDLAKQTLYALGLTESEVDKIYYENPVNQRFYEIKSPIKGKVLQRNLTLGELVNNVNKVYEVADFEKVWIEISISQNDLQYLREGLPIEIIAADGRKAWVNIYQFTPKISEETRKATAIAVIENNADKWTPGEFVSVRIQTNSAQASIVIPKEAIQNIKGEEYVFVEESGNFVPRPVKVGKTDEKNAEIISGLQQGEKYAASNAFLLKAEYEKEEAKHSHP